MPSNRFTITLRGALVAVTMLLNAVTAQAMPEYAKKEGVTCVYCHVKPGGSRNYRGLYYGTHRHSFAAFDNVYEAKLAGVMPDTEGPDAVPTVTGYSKVKTRVGPALTFIMKDIDGKTVNLGRYQNKVILMVNVASRCGFTPQYAALEKLYEKYKDEGFVILGFPANEFSQQEPGTNAEIKTFCTSEYNVTFPMFSKIVVKGAGISPLYQFLTGKESDPKFAGEITGNFNKFLLNRNGEVIVRFDSEDDPMSPQVVAEIEKALETK